MPKKCKGPARSLRHASAILIRLVAIMAGILAFVETPVAEAAPVVLATVTFAHGGETGFFGHQSDTGLRVFVEEGGYRLFENLLFGLGHSSGTFHANAANDPDFTNFANLLGNGQNNTLWFRDSWVPSGLGGGTGISEFQLFGGNDLQGAILTEITLQLNSLDVSINGTAGSSTIQAQVIFEGVPPTVLPLPSTALLMASGIGGLSLAGTGWKRKARAARSE